MASHFLTKILDNKIRSALQSSKAISNVAHPTVKGGAREGFLVDILDSVLPPHLGIGSGIIIDKWDRTSPQADIIIYDKRLLPPVISIENNGVYPIDSVHRVIKVKSTLDEAGVHQALNLAWSLHPANEKALRIAISDDPTNGQAIYPLVSCFAYSTHLASLPYIAEKWITERFANAINSEMFCIPQKGLFVRDAHGGYRLVIPGNVDEAALIRIYLSKFLHLIEDSINSRKNCIVLNWLSN